MKAFWLASTGLVALSMPVHAQSVVRTPGDATPPATSSDTTPTSQPDAGEIVVTGSLIRGTPKDAALPVAVVSADEIQKRGSPTILDLVKSLPIAGPVFGETNQFSTAAVTQVGSGSINLRGLGNQRTLILFNGRRIVSSPGQTSGGPDTELIPAAAIGRIEVLKDGAAATYGSDAIAGVVNFISKTRATGLDLTADYRRVPGSKGDYTASAVWGWHNDRLDVLVTAGYQHRSELTSYDRKSSRATYLENPAGFSFNSNPGTFRLRQGTTVVGTPVLDANCGALGGFSTFSGTTPGCAYFYPQFLNLVEKTNKYQIYAQLNYDLTDTIKFHLEGEYGKTSLPSVKYGPSYSLVNGPFGPGGTGQYVIPASNPGFNAFLQQTGNAALIGRVDNVTNLLWRPFAFGGDPATGGRGSIGSRITDIYRFSAAVDGKVTDAIDFDVAATYSEQNASFRFPDILVDRLQRALNGFGGPNCTGTTPGANGCQYLNPFSNAVAIAPVSGLVNPGYVPANANSASLADWLFDNNHGTRERQTLFVVDAVLSGKLGIRLPGGPIGWAIGGQYRQGRYQLDSLDTLGDGRITPCPVVGTTTCAFQTGPYIYQGLYTPVRLHDRVKAAFGELSLPILDTVNAQLAARYEDYGGLTGSTFNPKAAVKWQVVQPIALRGSISTTFRGPTSIDRAPTGSTSQSAILAAGNQFKVIDLFGNPAVAPEKALNFNVGTVVKVAGLTFTVDYFNYRLKNQIVSVPANVIASAVGGSGNGLQFVNCGSALRSLITFDNSNSCVQGVTVGNDISRVRSDTTNGATVHTSGLDFDVNYRIPRVFGGSLAIGGVASRTLVYRQDDFFYKGALVSTAYSALGFTNYNRSPGTISKWRGQAFADYSLGAHNLRLTFNYTGGAKDNRGPTAVQTGPVVGGCSAANAATTAGCQLIDYGLDVRPFYTFDLAYRVQLPWEVTLTASVFNLFDRAPSAARLELSYDPYIGSAIGRSFKLGLQKHF